MSNTAELDPYFHGTLAESYERTIRESILIVVEIFRDSCGKLSLAEKTALRGKVMRIRAGPTARRHVFVRHTAIAHPGTFARCRHIYATGMIGIGLFLVLNKEAAPRI